MVMLRSITEAGAALEAFISAPPSETRHPLDRMCQLMAFLGNPQNTLRVVHVAGTSGKTSTAYYCAALIKAAGRSVGLTVSPHIDKVSERAQINLEPLEDALYCHNLGIFLDLVKESGVTPTYFEVLVAFAFWLFERQGVEYAVVEVGIGGLLDSTNIVTRSDKVCIITDIGLDHTELLGKTEQEIATQKAGIIHPHNLVFMYQQSPLINKAVQAVVKKKSAELVVITEPKDITIDPKLPSFQRRNLYLSLESIQYLLGTPLSRSIIKQAASTQIPARSEAVLYLDKTLILDGSHNPQKLAVFAQSITERYTNTTKVLLVSFGENKEATLLENMQVLRTLGGAIIITAFSLGDTNPRKAIHPDTIKKVAEEAGFTDITVEPNPVKALSLLVSRTEDIGVITGSFYLLNHIRPIVFGHKL